MPDVLHKILTVLGDEDHSNSILLERAEMLACRLDMSIDRFTGEPSTQEIVRRAQQVGASLIMKSALNSSYLTGFATNLDWDLIRHSPAHLWFVGSKTGNPASMLTAVGSSADSLFNPLDYDVGELVKTLQNRLELRNLILHTCKEVTSERSSAIRAWADYFQLATADVRVLEGRAVDQLSAAATELDVDLIAMGARNLSRFERFITPVTAEPVLCRTSCDVLIVRDTWTTQSASAAQPAQPEF